MKHFLSITDVSANELLEILSLASKLKEKNKQLLVRKTLLMFFEKPSFRTRLSFTIGMQQLGGTVIDLPNSEIGLSKRESCKDIAQVASRMGDFIMARVYNHQTLMEFAKHSQIPVINGLSNIEHPCQILADLLTMQEIKGNLHTIKVAYFGDAKNNVARSLAFAASMLGMHLMLCSPKEYMLASSVMDSINSLSKQTGAVVLQTTNIESAAKNADVIYTDTWVNMGDEAEKKQRFNELKDFQVTSWVMQLAKADAIFMHDMPVYRGNEVVKDVADGLQSVIYQQAENRLHAQKGLLTFLTES